MTLFLVYLFLTIPSLIPFFGVICAIALGIAFVVVLVSYIESKPFNKKLIRNALIVGAIAGFIANITPTKEVAYTLAGVYAAQLAMESDTGKMAIELLQNKMAEMLVQEKKVK